jgi:hypothetical protein
MRRISSSMTFFYKWVFPIFWFGISALVLATGLAALLFGGKASGDSLVFLLVPASMAIVGYFIMRKLVFDLVDEVLDAGDALVIRNRGIEERIPLADIINVNYAQATQPPRVTLSLRSRSQFGDRVTFCAPVRFSPSVGFSLFAMFSPIPVIDDLIKRIDAVRREDRTAKFSR